LACRCRKLSPLRGKPPTYQKAAGQKVVTRGRNRAKKQTKNSGLAIRAIFYILYPKGRRNDGGRTKRGLFTQCLLYTGDHLNGPGGIFADHRYKSLRPNYKELPSKLDTGINKCLEKSRLKKKRKTGRKKRKPDKKTACATPVSSQFLVQTEKGGKKEAVHRDLGPRDSTSVPAGRTVASHQKDTRKVKHRFKVPARKKKKWIASLETGGGQKWKSHQDRWGSITRKRHPTRWYRLDDPF